MHRATSRGDEAKWKMKQPPPIAQPGLESRVQNKSVVHPMANEAKESPQDFNETAETKPLLAPSSDTSLHNTRRAIISRIILNDDGWLRRLSPLVINTDIDLTLYCVRHLRTLRHRENTNRYKPNQSRAETMTSNARLRDSETSNSSSTTTKTSL